MRYFEVKDLITKNTQRLSSKEECCLYIRSNKIEKFKVYEKDDSHMPSKRDGSALIFPLPPICNDVTSEIIQILATYKEMEES